MGDFTTAENHHVSIDFCLLVHINLQSIKSQKDHVTSAKSDHIPIFAGEIPIFAPFRGATWRGLRRQCGSLWEPGGAGGLAERGVEL